MKKNLLERIRDNLWVLVMDVIAVNAAYMLTFFLRYYVHSTFVQAARPFISDYLGFAPFYTVICVAVFAICGLYNGMWRYATINDMNRIVVANVAATLLHILGSSVFSTRLPMNVYAIGASFQLIFTAIIRYAFRIVDMEMRRIKSGKQSQRNVMVVGTGTNAANMIRYLMGDTLYKPVVAIGSGKAVHGIPVAQDVEEAIKGYGVNCVIIADPAYSDRKREALGKLCDAASIELHDYSGFLKNQAGVLSLMDLTKVISGSARVRLGDRVFDSVEQAMEELKGRYTVREISGDDMTIEIVETANTYEDWAKAYKEQTGEDVSFF